MFGCRNCRAVVLFQLLKGAPVGLSKLHDSRVISTPQHFKKKLGPDVGKVILDHTNIWVFNLDIASFFFRGGYLHNIQRKKLFFTQKVSKLRDLTVCILFLVPAPSVLGLTRIKA